MPKPHGSFVWYDLMTDDLAGALEFYGQVVGWEEVDSGLPGDVYKILSSNTVHIGGIMPTPEDLLACGTRAAWRAYIGVSDVDAYAARAQTAGGKIHRPPQDIPGVGRFAVIHDPHGAAFVLFKGEGTPQPKVPAQTSGHVGWHELCAGHGAEAMAYYTSLFGWTEKGSFDMGAMGAYQFFATDDVPVGGIFTKPPDMPAVAWHLYFNVDAIDAAAARVARHGGTVCNPPHQVPGGSWILQALDPRGARFGFVAPKR